MKRIVVAVVLAVFLLSGCGSKSAETPDPVQTVSAEDRYLANVKANMPDLESVPDADLLETGNNACGALDRGASVGDLFTLVLENGIDPQLAGTIVGGAVKDLCPEHRDEVQEYLNQQGV